MAYLTGRHMGAQEAHRLGVVNEIVPLAEKRKPNWKAR